MTSEFETKQERIQVLLDKHKLGGLLLRRVNNFAWATCGASACINIAESSGEASLLITRTHLRANLMMEENDRFRELAACAPKL